MPGPVVIAGCKIEIDLSGKSLPKLECRIDRERTANPDLQKGLVCETEFDVFNRDGKQIQRWEVVCRPPMKLYKKLRNALSPNLIEELKERMRHQPSPGANSQTKIQNLSRDFQIHSNMEKIPKQLKPLKP
jgi:hypothetical protein